MNKLFVWDDIFWECSAGVAFALAENIVSAKEEIMHTARKRFVDAGLSATNADVTAELEKIRESLDSSDPKIYTGAYGDYRWGSSGQTQPKMYTEETSIHDDTCGECCKVSS